MSKPITPDEIAEQKPRFIPGAVFDAFNAEISIRFSNGHAKVMQDTIVARLVEGGMDRNEIFDSGWLNVEEAYRAAGWDVEYDKPGFNESGKAYFTFKRPK